MLFNSYGFILVFLPVVVAGFFLLGRESPSLARGWLAGASLVFYGLWDWRFVPLLLASVAFNYGAGKLLAGALAAGRRRRARLLLILGVGTDLLLLGGFKYLPFLAGIFTAVTGRDAGLGRIILPIGISFFTFTQIAYLVDIARGLTRGSGFVSYLLFVSYFPHLIAGPVLHHGDMMPQFAAPATFRPDERAIAVGFTAFILGLFKKVALADQVAPFARAAFVAGGHPGASLAWAGALAYTLQIYLDFSAYSDMAIGLSRMLNIRLPANFESPYKAASIIDFWRRWHISLSRFLRDYLYIPLGGGRRGTGRRYANLLLTMVLGGLWHGAGWTFVLWGGLHGVYLIVNHGWRHVARHLPPGGRAGRFAGWALTMLAVILAWVLFRAPDIGTAWAVLCGMAGLSGAGRALPGGAQEGAVLAALGIMVLALPNLREVMRGESLVLADPAAPRPAALGR
ncbi:MAG: MBOAT family protein, partial [Rhodospirillales bacterium]|nr:MBOAT family protein [Rhodospirillales bacterium]